MTDHLPECTGRADVLDGLLGPRPCICPALRACEKRILLSKPNIELSAVYGYEAGRVDGISEAREAVAALDYPHIGGSVVIQLDDALSAIDALKERTREHPTV